MDNTEKKQMNIIDAITILKKEKCGYITRSGKEFITFNGERLFQATTGRYIENPFGKQYGGTGEWYKYDLSPRDVLSEWQWQKELPSHFFIPTPSEIKP